MADADDVARLGNGRVGLDALDPLLDAVAAAPPAPVLGANLSPDFDAARPALAHVDAAGTRLDLDVGTFGDGERAFEGPVRALRVGRSRNQHGG